MTIKILLADDRCLMLEGIKAILKHEPEIEVIGTAQDGRSAIVQTRKLQPDIVLMDIEMPEMNGIAATKHICQHQPDIRVIVLTSHQDNAYVTQALQAGASGYLLKETLIEDLKQAIYSLGRGYSYIQAQLLTQAVNKIQKTNIVKYQEKITYLKKYRKSIYIPSTDILDSSPAYSSNFQSRANLGVTKANLSPIFDSTTDSEFLTAAIPEHLRPSSLPKIHRRTDRKKITWLLIAIASLILSIIIF